ncbi:MAG: hypothetical protein WA982_03450 [Rubrobacteraceae bacterium]
MAKTRIDSVSGGSGNGADLLVPDRFQDPVTAYGYQRIVFEQVASGARPRTISVTASARHVGVTRKDTLRSGFDEAVRASNEEGYPVMVRGSGGGATAADEGTFGFSIVRPAGDGEIRRDIRGRYDEAADLVLGAFSRLGVESEVGEVRDEFCPGDHSVRVGGWEKGMKIVGIAQRITRRATSVGGIVLVHGEEELAKVLEKVYRAMKLPFRTGSVGSLHRAGVHVGVEEVVEAFAAEAMVRYGAKRTLVDAETLETARQTGEQHLISR